MSASDEVAILVYVNFADFKALGRLKDDALTAVDSLNDDLREGYVSEFKLALVTRLLEADVKYINRSAERADTDLRSIMFPSTGSDRIVVFDLFAADLIPLRTLSVEVEYVEAIIVSNDAGLTSSVEGSAGKFLNFLVFAKVESLEGISSLFIESNFTVVTSSKDVRTPGKSIRNGRVLNLELSFSIQVEGD